VRLPRATKLAEPSLPGSETSIAFPTTSTVTPHAARPDVEALAAHFTDPLVLVDAGCRWGFRPEWDGLARYGVGVIGFEAAGRDVAAVGTVRKAWRHVRALSGRDARPGSDASA